MYIEIKYTINKTTIHSEGDFLFIGEHYIFLKDEKFIAVIINFYLFYALSSLRRFAEMPVATYVAYARKEVDADPGGKEGIRLPDSISSEIARQDSGLVARNGS